MCSFISTNEVRVIDSKEYLQFRWQNAIIDDELKN